MTITAKFSGFINVPLFEAPYSLPHIGSGGGNWASSYEFSRGAYTVSARTYWWSYFGTGRAANNAYTFKMDYQGFRAYSINPLQTDGNISEMQWYDYYLEASTYIAASGTIIQYNQIMPLTPPNTEATIDFVASASLVSSGFTNNFIQVSEYSSSIAFDRFSPNVSPMSFYVHGLQPFLRGYSPKTGYIDVASGGTLGASTLIQHCIFYLVSQYRPNPEQGLYRNTLLAGPRGNTGTSAIWYVKWFHGDAVPAFANFSFDNVGVQAAAIQFANWKFYSASRYGFTAIIATGGSSPSGAAIDIIHISSDLTRWYILRLVGQNANARAQVAALSATSTVKVDEKGYVWFQSKSVINNNHRVFNSYAFNFFFNINTVSVNYPPVQLPCFNPCLSFLLEEPTLTEEI